jgi:hypothetical protein
VICRLTIRLPDGTTLTKSDAGGYAGMPDSGDDDKSGFSDAFKRAAVKFGVGRYLYRDGVPRFVQDHIALAAAADPVHHAPATERGAPPAQSPPPADGHAVPQTGKALFAWIKQYDEKHGTGLLGTVSGWAKEHQFPARMVQWNAEQVQQAFAEAQSVIRADDEPVAARPTPRAERGRQPASARPPRS